MTRYAIRLLWLTLVVQAGWLLLNGLALHRSPGLDVIGAVIGVSVAGFALLHRRWRWTAVVVRVVMSADFLLAVADRLGILGPPGTRGVSWGDFSHFVDYTHTVVAFLPRDLAPALAVLATVAEISLGVALLLGVRLRAAALAAAALLGVYGLCMTISLPLAEQFHYNVFILAAAMLALATLDRTALTVDRLLARRGRTEWRRRTGQPRTDVPSA
ncbi:MAG: hypothetical protein ACR2JQ_01125 [Mycobacteriales bacterium]